MRERKIFFVVAAILGFYSAVSYADPLLDSKTTTTQGEAIFFKDSSDPTVGWVLPTIIKRAADAAGKFSDPTYQANQNFNLDFTALDLLSDSVKQSIAKTLSVDVVSLKSLDMISYLPTGCTGVDPAKVQFSLPHHLPYFNESISLSLAAQDASTVEVLNSEYHQNKLVCFTSAAYSGVDKNGVSQNVATSIEIDILSH